MFIKTFKRIHNKYYNIFKFIFFLRYLFGIFFISLLFFLLIPQFFDYSKKTQVLRDYFFEEYNLRLVDFEKIHYRPFPFPNFVIKSANLNVSQEDIKLDSEIIIIYPKLINVYDFKNFQSKKIIFDQNNFNLEFNNFKNLVSFFLKVKKKIYFKKSNLNSFSEGKKIFKLKNINFANYGFRKNFITGEIFGKKFETKIGNDFNTIFFKIKEIGLNIEVNFENTKDVKITKGNSKIKILNTNLKFDFYKDDEKISIFNSFFRNKNISFNSNTNISFQPFFETTSSFLIKHIHKDILDQINLEKIIDNKNLLMKVNSKNLIQFKSSKFSRGLIEELNLNLDLAYGRLTFLKKIVIQESNIQCQGDINLIDKFNKLYFNCILISDSKDELHKRLFSDNKLINSKLVQITTDGSINILNNIIFFKSIKIGKDYEATKADLDFFKNTFENIFSGKDFIFLFNEERIDNFIKEIT